MSISEPAWVPPHADMRFAMLPWVPMLTHEKRHVSVMYTWHGFPHVNMGGVSASPTPSGPTPTSEPRVSTYAACQHGVARADTGGMSTWVEVPGPHLRFPPTTQRLTHTDPQMEARPVGARVRPLRSESRRGT